MDIQELVTIIIPTYNRAAKILDAVKSAVEQSYPHTQIIVIDDGSTDNTAELLKQYPQIEYYYKENGGQASARNYGLKNSKGTIIASLDSDDVWYPDFLSSCVEKLQSENLDFVFANWDQDAKQGDTWNFLLNDPFLKPYFKKEANGWINLEYTETRDLYLNACPSPSSSVVLRKSSIVSGWDEQINIGDDWCLYLEMILSKECKVAFTMNKLWHKRIDNNNVYDGRKWSEILEFLYVADLKKKMSRFKHLLTRLELKILQERYMASLVELSKHNLIREFRIFTSLNLLGQSFAMNIPYTLKAIPNVFIKGLQNKIKK
ncbi:glycosyltransferase involved in cell wall biosynthesis [Pedobacter africanus]|uniref:Glycosyltransferase involved in cell wall biosynthesis n=1 Tax=Pedobacter africanus TaxID=151894 RepID=A0ACC6KTK6_9SPHI|nr:glycosyltransferase family 2 protein [Pedobacter africanus]MDR6782475.1 glycosyltransferase involved in cell wall biosynthesis [Pedobacter africanus]